MRWQMDQILETEAEIANSKSYTNIRFWEADQVFSDVPLDDVAGWPMWQVKKP